MQQFSDVQKPLGHPTSSRLVQVGWERLRILGHNPPQQCKPNSGLDSVSITPPWKIRKTWFLVTGHVRKLLIWPTHMMDLTNAEIHADFWRSNPDEASLSDPSWYRLLASIVYPHVAHATQPFPWQLKKTCGSWVPVFFSTVKPLELIFPLLYHQNDDPLW